MVPTLKMQLLVIISVCSVCAVCFFCVRFGDWDLTGSSALNNDHQCGVEASSNLIHHNPWLAYLEYFNKDVMLYIRCAATLIGSRHLVTAAHCVKKIFYTRLVVRLGEYDLNTITDVVDNIVADPVRRINVSDIIIHPTYDGSNDDIAILVLEEDAPYTDFIRPICLPTGNINKNNIFSAAGWGELTYTHIYAHIKKIIPLPYWSRQDCQNTYSNLILPERVICAGGEEGLDTCRGDSGGPLTLIKGKTELWGVTSSGNLHCGTEGSPGIYTSVKDHLEWINDIVDVTSSVTS